MSKKTVTMNSDSVIFEYLLKLRQPSWENADVIDNIFGSIVFEAKSGERKMKIENWCKVNCEESSNSDSCRTKEGCRQNRERAEGRLYQTLDYSRAINVHVVLTNLDSHEYIREYNSCGKLDNQPVISFDNSYSSKVDPPGAATHSEHMQRNNVCSICHKKFTFKSHLTRHLRTHTGDKPFSCPQCEKKFAQKGGLKGHMLIHCVKESIIRPFSCDICCKTFSQKGHLTVHRLTHTGDKPFKCTVCNAMFSQSSTLNRHMRTHTGETPYQCEICERRFTQNGNLKTHLLSHSSEKPFACTYANCDKTFRRKDELQSHIRVHTKEKPYSCPKCNKTFSWSGHCKTHTKQCSVTKSVSSYDSSPETGEKQN